MITFRMRFDASYLWIGVLWQHTPSANGYGYLNRPTFDLWICLLPCLPIHVRWMGKEAKSPENASWIVLGGQKPDHASSVAKTDIDHG